MTQWGKLIPAIFGINAAFEFFEPKIHIIHDSFANSRGIGVSGLGRGVGVDHSEDGFSVLRFKTPQTDISTFSLRVMRDSLLMISGAGLAQIFTEPRL